VISDPFSASKLERFQPPLSSSRKIFPVEVTPLILADYSFLRSEGIYSVSMPACAGFCRGARPGGGWLIFFFVIYRGCSLRVLKT